MTLIFVLPALRFAPPSLDFDHAKPRILLAPPEASLTWPKVNEPKQPFGKDLPQKTGSTGGKI
jgi:hypothetical protein